jgi:hypothetical protein
VFGVSSDEYLNYAMKNRKEWEHSQEKSSLRREAVTAKAAMSTPTLPPTLAGEANISQLVGVPSTNEMEKQ